MVNWRAVVRWLLPYVGKAAKGFIEKKLDEKAQPK